MLKISLIILLTLTLQAREVIENTGTCKINWSQGFISCEGESAAGQSRYSANVAAKVIAQRNLLEVIKGVRIDSLTTVEDGMITSDIIQSRVSGVIKGAQVLSNNYNTAQRYSTATIKLQMGKDLLDALLSDPKELSWNEKIKDIWKNFHFIATANASTYTSRDKETIKKVLEDLRKRGDKKGTKYFSDILEDLSDSYFSGILIDISNVANFQKAMIVKLVDEHGKELYPASYVTKRTLIRKNTSVGYMYGLDDARKNARVFSKPLELKVIKTYKKRYSNIVLDKAQIKQLESLDKRVLQNAKIILVLGE